jgi:hypothetical protein
MLAVYGAQSVYYLRNGQRVSELSRGLSATLRGFPRLDARGDGMEARTTNLVVCDNQVEVHTTCHRCCRISHTLLISSQFLFSRALRMETMSSTRVCFLTAEMILLCAMLAGNQGRRWLEGMYYPFCRQRFLELDQSVNSWSLWAFSLK